MRTGGTIISSFQTDIALWGKTTYNSEQNHLPEEKYLSYFREASEYLLYWLSL